MLLVHVPHTLSKFFSTPGLCSPLVPERALCSRMLYLSEDGPNEKVFAHYVSIYEIYAILNPEEERKR